MIELLGYMGAVITLLVIVPASALAIINVFAHPIKEITFLWISLADKLMEIYEGIKSDINSLR
jgi:hypothetical protein